MDRLRWPVGLLAVALAACSSADAQSASEPHNAEPLVGITGSPPTAPTVPISPPTTHAASPASANAVEPTGPATIAVEPSDGLSAFDPSALGPLDRRVFLLGDSILESTSRRYYDTMEPALEHLGWEPTIEAIHGRSTAQAEQVLRRNRDDVGDALVVLIGHNDPPSAREYRASLEDLLEEVDDVPRVLLLTIREFDEDMAPLNGVVRSMERRHPNVEVVEWGDVVADARGALGGDELHLTERGAELLAAVVAEALGPAPGDPQPDQVNSDR
jgi:hypothetical protein